jgi:hypothetical protein
MRARLLSVPCRFAFAALMAVSALGVVRADPPAAAAGRGDAKESVALQPAAAQPPLATPSNKENATQARSDPASRTRKTKPLSAHHQLPPRTRHLSASDAAGVKQLRDPSAPVNGPRPATAPPQAALQAKDPTPSAAPPPAAHGAEPVVTQTPTSDPDPRDAGPHADRTSRDRAER